MLEHKSVNISFFYSDSFEFGDKNKASDDYAYDATGVKLRVRHVSPISAMASDVTFHMDRFDTALQSIASLIEVEEAPSVRASLTDLMQGLAVSNNMTIASDISGTSKTSSKTTTKSSTSSTLPKVQVSPASELSEHDEHVTDYCGNLIYEDGVLNKILFDGGCITFEDGSPVYHVYFRDHLGSVRVVCDRNGNAEQVNHYYPYGGLIGDLSTDDNKQKYRYKYNGKEFDRMHGLDTYDYGARQYNPADIIWDRIDPLCQKYYHISPYVYCAGNPIRYVDPDGRWIANVTGALAGEVFELGTQLAGQYISKGSIDWGEVDWADVAISTLEGGLTCGSSIVKNATKKSAISASAAVARVIIDKDHISNKMQENALDEVAGHVGGKIANKLAPKITPFKIKSNNQAVKQTKAKGVQSKKKLDYIRKTHRAKTKEKK